MNVNLLIHCSRLPGIICAFLTLLAGGCGRDVRLPESTLKQYVLMKESAVRAAVKAEDLSMPAGGWALFNNILDDDFLQASNTFHALCMRSGRLGLPTPSPMEVAFDTVEKLAQKTGIPLPVKRPVDALYTGNWHGMADAYWSYFLTRKWRLPLLESVLQEMAAALPPGSIFIGDSDVGRFGLSMYAETREEGRPFFVITQHQFSAEPAYGNYIEGLYGKELHLFTEADRQKILARGSAGEFGSGQGAYMMMNSLMIKRIIDANPSRRVFVEPTWSIQGWMFPHLEPKGPVLEYHREPLSRWTAAMILADKEYWSKMTTQLIGVDLENVTSTPELCERVRRVHLRGEVQGGFQLADDSYAKDWFGTHRHFMTMLYNYWGPRCKTATDQDNLSNGLLLAYRQAFAICPLYSLDFADLLLRIGRCEEARLLLQTALAANPGNEAIQRQLEQLPEPSSE